MSVSKERTVSLWMETEVAPEAPPLRADDRADVVVVGSGIAGLSTAYELAVRGQDVVVLDRGPIGMGMTSRTTAHLTSICDDSFDSYISLRGLEAAKLFHQTHSEAVNRIEAVQREESIPCNFRRLDGFLFPAIGSDPSVLTKELEAVRRIGVAVEGVRGVPFKGQDKTRCLRYPDQATFHPLRYLRGLTRALLARNARLYADTVVESVEEDEGGVTVLTEGGNAVRALAAVIATNSPINDRVAIHTKQAPYRTYAMGLHHPARRNARWSLLGYARRLSLRPPPAGPRHDRLPDRRRRRP